MVQIRSLKPTVKIKMPVKPEKYRPPQRIVIVERRNRDFPPPTPQPTPCRLWQGPQGSDGYGWRKYTDAAGQRRPISMHRWVMGELLGRRLEPSEVVLHACDNPLCYRVSHLSIGTVQSNNLDMLRKGRASKPPVNVFHGECHPMAKLSAAQVREIRGHYQSGLYIKTIARMYDVSPSTVRRILSGVTWQKAGNRVQPPTKTLPTKPQVATASPESGALPAKRIKPVKPITKRDTR